MTKYDKILILLVILASIFGFVLINQSIVQGNQKQVEILINNQLYKKYTLDRGLDEKVIIESFLGKNIIHIDNNQVTMIQSTCPDQICVNMGTITEPGQMIVCLPHRLIVVIIGDDSDTDTIVN